MTARGFDHRGLVRKRRSKGLSQAALGALLGVTYGAVSEWERGKSTPATPVLPDLANAFDCTIDDLFTPPAVGAAR